MDDLYCPACLSRALREPSPRARAEPLPALPRAPRAPGRAAPGRARRSARGRARSRPAGGRWRTESARVAGPAAGRVRASSCPGRTGADMRTPRGYRPPTPAAASTKSARSRGPLALVERVLLRAPSAPGAGRSASPSRGAARSRRAAGRQLDPDEQAHERRERRGRRRRRPRRSAAAAAERPRLAQALGVPVVARNVRRLRPARERREHRCDAAARRPPRGRPSRRRGPRARRPARRARREPPASVDLPAPERPSIAMTARAAPARGERRRSDAERRRCSRWVGRARGARRSP